MVGNRLHNLQSCIDIAHHQRARATTNAVDNKVRQVDELDTARTVVSVGDVVAFV